MDIEAIRRCCLAFPHATENVQWGMDLCFKIDGKLFAVTPLEPAAVRLSFKCSAEKFAELCERPAIIPAPYMARAHWIALQQFHAIPDPELRDLLAESYRLVFERLPKKRQQALQAAGSTRSPNAPAKQKMPGPIKERRKNSPVVTAGKKSAKAGRTG